MSVFGRFNNPGGSSVFGGSTSTPFGPSATQNTLQQSQQQQVQQAAATAMVQSQLNPAASSLYQPSNASPHQKSVPEQIKVITEKWDPSSPNCAFKHYFYNKVDESRVPFYQPGAHEDPREWEEALQHKPAPGFMPVLCAGFVAMAERLKVQRRAVAEFNARLHEINGSLDAVLSAHDLKTGVRALAARRRHEALRRRCMGLAARVQVLRNRGYALSGDEDDLRERLVAVEKRAQDPAVSARLEEIWSRLMVLRDLADRLKAEAAKPGAAASETAVLPEEVEAKVKKIIEDYEKQLRHLKKEVESIRTNYDQWEKEHPDLALSRKEKYQKKEDKDDRDKDQFRQRDGKVPDKELLLTSHPFWN